MTYSLFYIIIAYILSLIIAFYIMSRIVTIISIVANYEQIGGTEFLTKIIFHVVNLIILLISVKAIISKKQKIVIGVIIYNILNFPTSITVENA